MSERYMYKLTYKPTLELARKLAWLDDDPRIGKKQTILLDAIEDTTVSADSTISTHPQLNGEAVADHMYKNPVEVNISGAFSAYGGTLIDTSGNTGNSMMQWIQGLFEAIKDYAIVCTLTKVSMDGSSSSVRFRNRNNMVLQSISWTEKLTSMSYTFKFVEIMMATVQEYSTDTSDPFLPSIDVLQSISFMQEVIDWSMLNALIIQAAIESGWVDARIAEQAMGTLGVWSAIGVGAGIATGVALTSWLTSASAAAAASSSVPVAGWIIGGIIALGCIGVGIYNAIHEASLAKKFKEDQIKYHDKDMSENIKEVERFTNFLSNIGRELLKLDDAVMAYSMTITDPCQFYVNFENNYYLCEVQNTAPSDMSVAGSVSVGRRKKFHAFILKDLDGNPLGRWVQIETAHSDLFDCASSNAIYRLPYTGSYIYLLRKYSSFEIIEEVSEKQLDLGNTLGGGSRGTISVQTNVKKAVPKDPTDTYYLIATKIAPEQFSSVITNIVINAIMR